MKDRPLLRLLVMMVAGMVVGRYVDVPWRDMWWGVAALVLLLAGVLLRQRGRVASVLLMAAAMVMGVYRERDGYALDVQENLGDVRQRLSRVYIEQGIDGDEYGVVSAMTLGERNGLDRELKEVYRVSGAAHVFALSGMHLGILFMIMTYVLPVRRWPKACMVIEMLGLWMYVLIVGCGASVVRAAVMLSAYCVARMFSRNTDSISVLLFTAGLMLVVRPQWLFDVGFQMSFMAVASIVVMYKPLYGLLPDLKTTWRIDYHELSRNEKVWECFITCSDRVLHWLWGLTALSLVAQIGVAPLVAHYFHRFSSYFLLTNYIVSPCALIIIVLALILMLSVAMAGIMPWLGFMPIGVAKVLAGVVHLQNDILTVITKMPYASIDGIRLNVIQTVLVYVIIMCMVGIAFKFSSAK